MKRIEGGFTLTALLDGTTINAILRVEGLPLVQRYTKDTGAAPIPNFESPSLPASEKPTLVLIIRDVSTGRILNPNSVTWKYNGTVINFDSAGLSTNPAFVGVFSKIDDYSASIDSTTYHVRALRVLKNLVVIGQYDNDRLSCSGTIEINGQTVDFKELSKDVIIQESSGNAYDVVITDNKGSALLEDGESLTAKANLYKDGVEVVDYSGVTFQWVKMLGTGNVNWGTSQEQIVSTSDIDNVLKLRCDVKVNGSLVASGFTQISDFSDPYYVDFRFTGITGNTVRVNETAVVTPLARKRSTGEIVPRINTWSFSLSDNEGTAFKLPGKGITFEAESATITYEDMKKAGMGISGSVSAAIN